MQLCPRPKSMVSNVTTHPGASHCPSAHIILRYRQKLYSLSVQPASGTCGAPTTGSGKQWEGNDIMSTLVELRVCD